MTNRIKDLRSLNEEVEVQDTQESAPVEGGSLVTEIINANPAEGYTLSSTDDGLSVQTSTGYTFTMSNGVLDFYKQLFDDGAEHVNSYNRHLETVETALSTNDLKEVARLYKVIAKSLAPIEIKPDLYAIPAILLRDESIQFEEYNKLFNAYAKENYDLDEATSSKLSAAVNNGIGYYKFILLLFEHLDK